MNQSKNNRLMDIVFGGCVIGAALLVLDGIRAVYNHYSVDGINGRAREQILRVFLHNEINEINSLLSGSGLKVVSTNNGSLDVVREGDSDIVANITFQVGTVGTGRYKVTFLIDGFTVSDTVEDEAEVAGLLKNKYPLEEVTKAEEE